MSFLNLITRSVERILSRELLSPPQYAVNSWKVKQSTMGIVKGEESGRLEQSEKTPWRRCEEGKDAGRGRCR